MLFEKYTIKDMTLRNRIVMPPMCMYSAKNDGKVTPFHHIHYGARAQGGVGLVILEATAVEARGRISAHDLGIWDESQVEGLRGLVKTIHQFGAKAAIQLAHAGRKSETGSPVSPTAHRFSEDYQMPHALTTEEVNEVVKSFGKAAIRARQAGFDALEIHGAHGYLVNQFLSPLTNDREDQYKYEPGSPNLFLAELVSIVKRNFPGVVGVRISAESYIEGGLHPTDYTTLLRELQISGPTTIEFVDVSSGGITPESYPPRPTLPKYQVAFAAELKKRLGYPVITGGLVTSLQECEQILRDGSADMVWLGRELLRNPYWPLQAAGAKGVPDLMPLQYKRAEPYNQS